MAVPVRVRIRHGEGEKGANPIEFAITAKDDPTLRVTEEAVFIVRADQRFAAFLVNLSTRYAARGYSSTHFALRMSREEIGNYLGLTIESVSRLLSRFKKQGCIKVDKREVMIADPAMLKAIAAGTETCGGPAAD